jgi:NitT/TauT family transport system ATP-binding protein
MTETVMSVEGLYKSYGSGADATQVIAGLDFEQRHREFLVIVGPSGCGKTTLLRTVAGLQPADAGAVTHHGRPVEGIPSWLSVVFQDYNRSLFPWLTVDANVQFPLHELPRSERAARSREALESVGLADFRGFYPWQLSGGMQQRVAIARGIASQPELLLMDEPFASVDAQTRMTLEGVVLDLWRRLDLSILFVTHDIDEAVFLADRVLVLSQRPTRVVEELEIDLPRPRDQVATKALPEFAEKRRAILDLIGVAHA